MNQPLEVKIIVTVTVNERPIWQKAKKVKSDLAGQLPEELYDKVLWTTEHELDRLLKLERAKENK